MSTVNSPRQEGIFKPGGFLISWMSKEYLHCVSRMVDIEDDDTPVIDL